MISVKLPDGATAQFPDGTPPEVMTKAIQAKYPPQGAQPQPAGELPGTPGNPADAGPAFQDAMAQASQASQQLKGAVDNPHAWRRGTLAPVERNEQSGSLRPAMPQIVLDAASAFQLPGDVMSGKVDPMSPEGLDRSALFGTMAAAGGTLPRNAVAPLVKDVVTSGVDSAASAGIKSVASKLFDSAKAGNATIAPQSYTTFVENLTRKIVDSGLDKSLHPDTYAALNNLLSRRGNDLTFKDLHIVRQIAQDASRSAQARDGSKARTIVTAIDDFVKGLKPADMAGGADPTQAANDLLKGISTWSKGAKAATIEGAIYRAQNVASGTENGLRNEFRKILQSDESRRLFSADEIKGIEAVVRGTAGTNLMKLIGKFGFGSGQAANAAGGAFGLTAASLTPLGPLGGILASLGATGARHASLKMTEAAAQRTLDTVASGLKRPPPPPMVMLPERHLGPAFLQPYEINQNRRGARRAIE